jgi:phenylacetate-CoA ligase
MTDTDDFRASLDEFLTTSLHDHLNSVTGADRHRWRDRLSECAARTPAYRQFLAERNLTPADLSAQSGVDVPVTNKPDYILKYPLADRCLDGQLGGCDMIAVSSGTTRQAVLWPRCLRDEMRAAFAFEHMFRTAFEAHQRTTLVVVCLPLGIWIGGMHTASTLRLVAAKGYPITVVSPGINQAEIRRCLTEVAPLFEQTILCGYPPFVRDVVDALVSDAVDPAQTRIRLLLAGEAISEAWRDDMSARLEFNDVTRDRISMYGTADAGVVAFETPTTISLRRALNQSPASLARAFKSSLLPALFQYHPYRLRIDEKTDSIVISSLGVHPLFRYDIGDAGRAMPHEDLIGRVGGDAAAPRSEPAPALPFVALFGRTDGAVKFFGGKVYPEHVAALLDRSEYRRFFTGRFTILVRHTEAENQPLTIIIEARADTAAPASFSEDALSDLLESHLMEINSEYASYVPRRYQRPDVVIKSYADTTFFPRIGKQVYVRDQREGS